MAATDREVRGRGCQRELPGAVEETAEAGGARAAAARAIDGGRRRVDRHRGVDVRDRPVADAQRRGAVQVGGECEREPGEAEAAVADGAQAADDRQPGVAEKSSPTGTLTPGDGRRQVGEFGAVVGVAGVEGADERRRGRRSTRRCAGVAFIPAGEGQPQLASECRGPGHVELVVDGRRGGRRVRVPPTSWAKSPATTPGPANNP